MPGGGTINVPVGWLRDYADLPEKITASAVGEAFVRVGLEVESLHSPAEAMSGPIVVGRVLEFADEPQRNGKTIRWCQVDVGPYNNAGEPRGIVCGAHNFAAGDLVVVTLPGAVLPGPFEISARKTYGHVSDGMICSVRELGIGDDHEGILVLPPDSADPGADALDVLGLRESVVELAVTPDRGYCLSMRGLAREAAGSLGVAFRDVADTVSIPPADGGAYDVRIDAPDGCDRFSARAVTGLEPSATSPDWMTSRLRQAGMRPISLAVDVTNYVMLETGQPLHAFDRARLAGPIVVRRARAGETLRTLDGVDRTLDPQDMLVTDGSGPIALAGVMGGESTEISATTTDIVFEAAHWDPTSIARAVRRHHLPSEAAKRFERDVDPEIAGVALARCVELLVEHGGAQAVAGYTVVGDGPARPVVELAPDHPAALVGMPIGRQAVIDRLVEVGCEVDEGTDSLRVAPPTWRPDLTGTAELIEEVARLEGYDQIPSELPPAPAGRGLSARQRLRSAVSRALAGAGATEVLSMPFLGAAALDGLGLDGDDERRRTVRLANPISDVDPFLRTSLLPGLFAVALRNLGRENRDLALFETGLVFRARPDAPRAPEPGVDRRPSEADFAAMDAAIPDQPEHAAVVLCGAFEPRTWAGEGRPADWADAVEFARVIAGAARAELTVRAGAAAPWHPGRCAQLLVDGVVIGHAGELHPRAVEALGLPPRTCALEVNLDLFAPPAAVNAPEIATQRPVLLDVALVVDAATPSAAVRDAIVAGAGELLDSAHLFDVYTDADRLGAGAKSLAFALRFRAPDRTLTVGEATAARDAGLARAAEVTGARLRE